jgi:NodT family efflux transporter outer membrane factor (OMF) lipoprotein
MKPRIAIAFAACLLSACNLAPPYRAPSATLGVLPVRYSDSGEWQPAAPNWPHGPWWLIYRDPQLDRLEKQLIVANPTLAAAVANYDTYKDEALALRAYLFPFVTATGLTTPDATSMGRLPGVPLQPTYYGTTPLFSEIHYEVDLWDQIHNQLAAGVASAQASADMLAWAQLSLEARLASAYLTLREIDNDIQLLVETVGAYQLYLQVVQMRSAGMIESDLPVAQARFQLEAAQAQESGVRAQRAIYEHMIATLVGIPAPGFSIPPKVMDIDVPAIPLSVPSVLLERRPDIAAAERRVAAANAEIGVARGAFYPNISINNMLSAFTSSSLVPIAWPLSFWSLGPSVAAPIFEGGLLHAQLAQSVARWHQAVQDYRAVVLRAFEQVEDGLSNLKYLSQEDEQQKEAVKDALDAQMLAYQRYTLGANNYLEVVVQQTLALSAEQTEINIKESLLQSNVNLILALGGGWTTAQTPDRHSVLTPTATNPDSPLPTASEALIQRRSDGCDSARADKVCRRNLWATF